MPVNGTVDSTANIFAGTTGITVLFIISVIFEYINGVLWAKKKLKIGTLYLPI